MRSSAQHARIYREHRVACFAGATAVCIVAVLYAILGRTRTNANSSVADAVSAQTTNGESERLAELECRLKVLEKHSGV